MPTTTLPWYGYHTTTQAKMQSRKLAAIYFRAGAELHAASYTARAARVQMCSDVIVAQDGKIISQWRCRDRLCPICAMADSHRIAANAHIVLQRALTNGRKAYMLTLTQLNCPATMLPGRITDMISAWRAILHDLRDARKYIAGYARTVEITRSARGDYHPHVHAILIMAADTPKVMLRAGYWADLWRDYMGTDAYQSVRPVCDIRPIRPNPRRHTSSTAAAAAEVAKYTAKSAKILCRSDAYDTILAIDAAIRGRQLRTYGGVWRALRRQMRLSDAPIDAPMDAPIAIAKNIPLEVWQWAGADVGYQRIQ